MYEVEVKAHLRDRGSVLKKLKDLGFEFGEVLHQVDRIFIPEGVSIPTPLGTPVLRVRSQNGKYIFTLKISQSGRQDSIERELEIADAEMMAEIIKLIKYTEAAAVDKKRIKAKLKDIEICLDTVKDLGEFVEAEKIVTDHNHEERKKIQHELCDFLETLGIQKADHLVNHKYDIMIFEKMNKK